MTENLKSARSAKIGKVFKVARKELGLTNVEVSNTAFMNIRYINAIFFVDSVVHVNHNLCVVRVLSEELNQLFLRHSCQSF